jgi:hypothetical protein
VILFQRLPGPFELVGYMNCDVQFALRTLEQRAMKTENSLTEIKVDESTAPGTIAERLSWYGDRFFMRTLNTLDSEADSFLSSV